MEGNNFVSEEPEEDNFEVPVHGEHNEGATNTVIGVQGGINVGEANNSVDEMQVRQKKTKRAKNAVTGEKSRRTNSPLTGVRGDKKPTCAACRHQKKKCPEECKLAPYFPSNMYEKYKQVQKIFGYNKVEKIMNELRSEGSRHGAVPSLLWEAQCWKNILDLPPKAQPDSTPPNAQPGTPPDSTTPPNALPGTPLAKYLILEDLNVRLEEEKKTLLLKISDLEKQIHEQTIPNHMTNGMEWLQGDTIGHGSGGAISSINQHAHMMNGYGNHDMNFYNSDVINNNIAASPYHSSNSIEGGGNGIPNYNGASYAPNRGTGNSVRGGGMLLSNANHISNDIHSVENRNIGAPYTYPPFMQQKRHRYQGRDELSQAFGTPRSYTHSEGSEELGHVVTNTPPSFNHSQGRQELSHGATTNNSPQSFSNNSQGREEPNHVAFLIIPFRW
ncbi:hypothetical protein IFM89_010040 [Coptis chinensis]|uniref:LOB domain-containing protein n=1 Tax=Coptis chinensis TaxID=261450 RepID=A0A835HJD8_9MAGN|nr:hypothetical protein IFM89_010040 [Coptis chinensis]